MCAAAVSTPLPAYRFASPSRNSTASREPVEAPEGTAARPTTPECSTTSASTVGLPRESMISRPRISTIRLIGNLRAGYSGIDHAVLRDRGIYRHQGMLVIRDVGGCQSKDASNGVCFTVF